MNKETTYTEAFEELKRIVSDVDRKEIPIDELAEKVRRAAQLVKICKSKLDSTEEDVNRILKELDTTSNPLNTDV
ncbi:MAG: exodeoxyribonuclease VII small subunit [Tannerella sp.]|jgi:exodeoxyribonuclease VII small subunit|nr:exodeoxyribonuclease VII small subunit [Tannerella sp.]